MKLGFLFGRLKNMDYSKYIKSAEKAALKCGKPFVFIIIDMAWCALKYGAGYTDYSLFGFYNMKGSERASYITRSKNNELVLKLNPKDKWEVFDNKLIFNEKFNRFIKRGFVNAEKADKDVIKAFINNKEYIFAKPKDGICGNGIEKIKTSDYTPEELLNYALPKNLSLIEEQAVQHPALDALYPGSVNTLRLVTLGSGEKCRPVFAALRLGRNGSVVDNLNSGGFSAEIDLSSGEIISPAIDKDGNEYYTHPDTGAEIKGFILPLFKEALKMVKEASGVVPEIKYLGWDVCIGEKEPLLIEANQFPGNDIIQLRYKKEGNGKLPLFYKTLRDIGIE